MKQSSMEMKIFVLIGTSAIGILLIASVSAVEERRRCCCCKNQPERGGLEESREGFSRDRWPNDDQRGWQNDDQRGWQNDDQRGWQNDDQRGWQNDDQRGWQNDDQRGWQNDDQRGWQNDDQRGRQNDGQRNNDNSAGENLSDQMKLVLDLHNKYRREVAQGQVNGQPPSNKIRDLKWNEELAKMAQAHADKCGFNHNSYEERATRTFPYVGQNFAVFSTIKEGVEKWFEEYKNYDYRANSCAGVCGHYTQMVWANTTDLGCGATKCNYQGFMLYYLICHYGPTGNFNNQRPY